ncbi:Hsp20 family protein [Flammeovirga yaeyamensis]|uniref:Hsp20 family protein n=1 Tax=Flammeovirga yaeyamensis TaxID=367791 RepID=A0AAX1N946_9BACT|nr:Hsp20/alpha crystallin family protein [Flammeovirga yaeyamensis]MBB3699779.1 HSP20 family protein [Flammeovirga yaeyamensis]NMF36652.1 Hsp20/alpha crystallin family protein [Flammeovirga yaeyamensis]QWG02303.1 Hsp20 family protein [Flammeovirga yaeyamensis]
MSINNVCYTPRNKRRFVNNMNQDLQKNIPVNIIENDKEYIVEFIVPKYQKENFSIDIEDKVLSVKYTSAKDEDTKEEVKYISNTYQVVDFEKKYKLPKDVNYEGFSASFNEGILLINLPKSEEKQPINIEIK